MEIQPFAITSEQKTNLLASILFESSKNTDLFLKRFVDSDVESLAPSDVESLAPLERNYLSQHSWDWLIKIFIIFESSITLSPRDTSVYASSDRNASLFLTSR